MRPSCRLLPLIGALGLVSAAQLAAQESVTNVPRDVGAQVFRAQSELVVLHVNVLDGRSDAIPDLPQEAFSVSEDGVSQRIEFFSSADVPVTVGLVVDNSGSMIARQKMVIAGSKAFTSASHQDDQLFAVVFNENVRFPLPENVAFTRNPVQMQVALGRLPAGGHTALYDAVVAALDHLEDAAHQKRVLIVLSDGDDNASRLREADMLNKARRSDAIIYTVSHAGAGRIDGNGNRSVLRKLADISGGVALFPSSEEDVIAAFARIARNIRRGYSIGYVPTGGRSEEAGFRRVQVRVNVPGRGSLAVRARDGYLVAPDADIR